MMNGDILTNCIDFLKSAEGYTQVAEKIRPGLFKIGYGMYRYPDGKSVEARDRISEKKASAQLEQHILNRCIPQVEEIQKSLKKAKKKQLTDEQIVALISYIYSSKDFDESECKKYLLQGDIDEALKYWDDEVFDEEFKKLFNRKRQEMLERRNQEIYMFANKRVYWLTDGLQGRK